MHDQQSKPVGKQAVTRRSFFERAVDGLQGAALVSLLSKDLYGAASVNDRTQEGIYDLKPRAPHFPATAKSVIQLFMNGAPSHVDLFDPKPMLDKHHGEPYFDKIANDVSFPKAAGGLMRSPFKFQQHGKSGIWVSELMPHFAKQVDNVAMIRSMYTIHPEHEPALFMVHSGRIMPGRPAIGSWVIYGLGTENQSLPAYVVLDDPLGLPINGVQSWQSGFLPPVFQGTRLRTNGSPILNLKPEAETPSEVVRLTRDLLGRLDQIHKRNHPGEGQLDARIASYELAARMQMQASDALDISKETDATCQMYGIGDDATDSYGKRCLMARRLVERGVRYIQIYINGQIWDHHTNLESGMRSCCLRTDKPVAGLLEDLNQRGLLKDTLVIWGGEFGRLPISQLGGASDGRDHNPRGFCVWMAGAGVKPGISYGNTDELGYKAVENPVSVTDWQATVLRLLGLDYQKLTFDDNGLKEKLTSVYEAKIVEGILA
ncbi:MAG: DUF1501 domain-containing protein [Acidobacteria bacterium]|nr:MAG: DUF1501 domain-containing protein [Acidobacteriota bacterium]